jgi:hypothetical protein
MMRVKLTAIALALFLAGLAPSTAPANEPGYEIAAHQSVAADRYYRTELYFGRSIPGGGTVSDEEWQRFLADVVTPRFPDGFTIIDAAGQYREKDGTIDREHTEVLVFLYPVNKRTAGRRKIDEIRRAYVTRFNQESVLRLDFHTPVDITF